MTKRQYAHRELDHVLGAFEDGLTVLAARLDVVNVARDVANRVASRALADKLARGVVGRDLFAAWAFRNAVGAVLTAGHKFPDPTFAPSLRKLAPVLLDVYLDALGIE